MMHNAHLTVHGFIGIGSHNAVIWVPPAPPLPPAILPHISMDTLLGLTIKAKFSLAGKVAGPCFFPFIGEGNDSGFVVPHICIPPPNVLIPIIIGFGQSKPMFSASTVKIGTNAGALAMSCCVFPFVPLSLNQACLQTGVLSA